MSYCRKYHKKKKKKKKRKYPLKFYRVEFEYTGYGSTYVRAECESQARSIAEDDSEVPFDNVEIEEVNRNKIEEDETILDENGNYE